MADVFTTDQSVGLIEPSPAKSAPHVNHPVPILLVDDRPENLLALDAVLEALDVSLVHASTGAEALRHLLDHDFALILLDAQMPGMDGYETAAYIRGRERSAATPIIFLTAHGPTETQIFRGYNVGAVDFIFKPFEPEVLRSKVKVFIRMHRNLRELEQQAELLRRSEERYALAAEGAADGLFDWDLTTGQAYFSPRWRQIVGCEDVEIEDSMDDWLNRIHPEEREAVRQHLESHLEARKGHFQTEHRLACDNTIQRWVLCRGLAIYDPRGHPLRMAGSFRDITDRKRAEMELRQKERLAGIGMTMAHLAHSMKNMFTPLQGGLGLLRKLPQFDDAQREQVLDVVESSIRRLYLLTMNMLDYSKEREIDHVDVDCRALFDDLARMLRAAASKRSARLEFTVEPGAESFRNDPERLLRCLLNLGGNAIDALKPEGGTVRFEAAWRRFDEAAPDGCGNRAGAQGRRAFVIGVSDDGLGMPEEVRQKVFEPFFSTKGSKGTGLGLASVRQFVEEAGGCVRVESAEGRGTTIEITFPEGAEKGEE